ncbi:MAG: cytochrome C [Burkholderiales bacterium]
MNLGKFVTSIVSGVVLGAVLLFQAQAMAEPAGLDNATCLSCHDGSKEKLKIQAEAGERALNAINPDKFGKGVHAKMACVACHTEIIDSTVPHKVAAGQKVVECSACHEALAKKMQAEGKPLTPGLDKVAKNMVAYRNSLHAHPSKEDKTRVNATCNDCHDTHSFMVPPRDTLAYDQWRLSTPALCGEKCHSDELDDYKKSIHGKESQGKGNLKAAVCVDCHTTHSIGNTLADPIRLVITANCGSCHTEQFKTYMGTYHGQINRLGYAYTAKCFDCHGSHTITKVTDTHSRVSDKNRLKTCRQCHNGKPMAAENGKIIPVASENFLSFGPHANAEDRTHYPQVWFAGHFMVWLLVGVFAFFWAHTLLWWFREYMDRHLHRARPHVRLEDLPKDEVGKSVRRFGLIWRIGHLFFAISVMLLILTGMTVFYAQTAWAGIVVHLVGGPHIAGLIHRASAYTMLSIFGLHLIGVCINIVRKGKNFNFFGPDSLVPNWKDLADIVGMFKWFLNLGPRPTLERWTYWEKFDYWAVFWGMFIIGGSGMMMAFPNVTAQYLPGWVFNVTMLVHGEEAFLCAVFLFTVHFFNNHFRPDKMPPPDVVMFTGVQSIEEFRREHTEQYNRLVRTGELSKYLVDTPSGPMTRGSKILGLTLLSIGLLLLVLVAIGFFGS